MLRTQASVSECWPILMHRLGVVYCLYSAQREKSREYYFLTKAVETEKQELDRLNGASFLCWDSAAGRPASRKLSVTLAWSTGQDGFTYCLSQGYHGCDETP